MGMYFVGCDVSKKKLDLALLLTLEPSQRKSQEIWVNSGD